MFEISLNNIVTATRGDTGQLIIPIKIGTALNPIIPELTESTMIYFGLMEPNKPFEGSTIRKSYSKSDVNLTDFTLTVTINAEDTECLVPGVYHYCVKLYLPGSAVDGIPDKVHTIVPKTKFIIVD